MKKIKIGVLGAARAFDIIKRQLCGRLAEVVIVCETNARLYRAYEAGITSFKVAFVTEFGRLLSSGIDAVIIANDADKHSAAAANALRHGLHVFCEPMPSSTLDETYLLEKAARESGKVFAYGEYSCYRRGIMLARSMIYKGDIGTPLSAECNFVSSDGITFGLTKPDSNPDGRWQSYIPSTFMCTGSTGPMMFATGLRAVRVSGAETPRTQFKADSAEKNAGAGFELLEFDGGAIGRSFHGHLLCQPDSSLRIYGDSGEIEVVGDHVTLHVFSSGRRISSTVRAGTHSFTGMIPRENDRENSEASCLACFVGKLLGDTDCAGYSIDVYRAFDMSVPGLLAYRSVIEGGRAYIVPNLRTAEGRDYCRGDRFSTNPNVEERFRLPQSKSH